MPRYVDAGSQTDWAGLTRQEYVRPDMLRSPPRCTTTPPDDMLTLKPQFVYGTPPVDELVVQASPPHMLQPINRTPSLQARRQNRAAVHLHISLPPAPVAPHALDEEGPASPPTTHALLSPLPDANKLHAGHTPLILRSPSPEADASHAPLAAPHAAAEDGVATPDADQGLTGALTLPANPGDGTDDGHIVLHELDHVLSKISRQQAELRGEFDHEPDKPASPEPEETHDSADHAQPLSRKGSTDSQHSSVEVVDGVRLKTPPSNFGAPLGSLGPILGG
ncbi:hypothetical protein ACEQ8H_007546 [Pleosporales sp. CAS-2024a]